MEIQVEVALQYNEGLYRIIFIPLLIIFIRMKAVHMR